jgi:hypothetical protein
MDLKEKANAAFIRFRSGRVFALLCLPRMAAFCDGFMLQGAIQPFC